MRAVNQDHDEYCDGCQGYKEMIAALEAELAALKGRRCDGCRYWRSEVAEAFNYAFHRHVCTNEDSVCFECELDDDSDFACNRWAERGTK